jgi:hypothetical protein
LANPGNMFRPKPGEALQISGTVYVVAGRHIDGEPTVAYSQRGLRSTVYQLVAEDSRRFALKVLDEPFRHSPPANLVATFATYAKLPGLAVCHRAILAPRWQDELLRQHPDLLSAVLMPWIDGPTWQAVVREKKVLAPRQSLALARALTHILTAMEEQGLAHCDLSGFNLLLPGLAESISDDSPPVALVDVEQLYAPGLNRPPLISSASPGYGHKAAETELWQLNADRFSGAVLIAEMLAWCDPQIQAAAWGDSFFDGNELQTNSDRFQLLRGKLGELWGADIEGLFVRAWSSETLADCPTLGEWLVSLPEQLGTSVARADFNSVPKKPQQQRSTDSLDEPQAFYRLPPVAAESKGSLQGKPAQVTFEMIDKRVMRSTLRREHQSNAPEANEQKSPLPRFNALFDDQGGFLNGVQAWTRELTESARHSPGWVIAAVFVTVLLCAAVAFPLGKALVTGLFHTSTAAPTVTTSPAITPTDLPQSSTAISRIMDNVPTITDVPDATVTSTQEPSRTPSRTPAPTFTTRPTNVPTHTPTRTPTKTPQPSSTPLPPAATQVSAVQNPTLPSGQATIFDSFTNYWQSGFRFSTNSVVAWDSNAADILAAKPQSFSSMSFFLQYDAPPFNNPDLDKDARSGIIAMQQTEMNQVSECPASGYTYHWAAANLGRVYCVRTRSGEHYAVIKLTSIDNNSLSFTWEYQPDGSRRFH